MNKLKSSGAGLDLIICLSSLTGLILNFNLFKNPVGILYYTIFSNLLCFVFYLYSLIKKIKFNFKVTDTYISIKGLVLVSLICTFMIYNFFMIPTGQVSAYDGNFIVSCFVHIITPILVVADCIIKGKTKMLKYKDLLLYLFVMTTYGLVVVGYQHLGGKFLDGLNYPYFNFNIDKYGLTACTIINIFIVVIYELIGLTVIAINRNVIKKH